MVIVLQQLLYFCGYDSVLQVLLFSGYYEITWKILNVAMKEDGEDKLDESWEKRGSITQSQGGQKHPTYSERRKAYWIGHMLCRNCL